MKELLNELLEIEKGFWGAAGGDGGYYAENLADDGLMILPFEGGILDKNSTIITVKESAKWDEFTMNKPRLMQISETKAVLVYEALGKRKGQKQYRALVSSLYVNRENRRYLLLHQQTAI